MAELEWQGAIEVGSLRRALRQALRRTSPGWRVVAEGFLGATSPIDLLAIGEAGELICIRATAEDAGDPVARLLASGLSDLGWITPRVADFQKLAPELGLRPLAPPRLQLFAPDFDAEVLAAVEHVSGLLGDDRLGLSRYRALRQQGQLTLLLEPLKAGGPSERLRPVTLGPAAPTPATDPASSSLVDPPSPSAFRTGLTDADLLSEPLVPA